VITVSRHAKDLALVVFLMCILVALPAALVLARTMPREDDLYDLTTRIDLARERSRHRTREDGRCHGNARATVRAPGRCCSRPDNAELKEEAETEFAGGAGFTASPQLLNLTCDRIPLKWYMKLRGSGRPVEAT
jgi:hypothetical protein